MLLFITFELFPQSFMWVVGFLWKELALAFSVANEVHTKLQSNVVLALSPNLPINTELLVRG
jgi:hypothetical protein